MFYYVTEYIYINIFEIHKIFMTNYFQVSNEEFAFCCGMGVQTWALSVSGRHSIPSALEFAFCCNRSYVCLLRIFFSQTHITHLVCQK
jgi:hypothetical protein